MDRLEQAVTLMLKTLREEGAVGTVSVSEQRSSHTRFARSELTSTGEIASTAVGVQAAVGKREASASTDQVEPASVRAVVRRAVAMAKLSPENPELMPPLGPQRYGPSAMRLEAGVTTVNAATRAEAAGTALTAAEAAGVDVAGFYSHVTSRTLFASSAGLRAELPNCDARMRLTARTRDGTGSGWAGVIGSKPGDIAPAPLVATAIDKAQRSRGPRRLEPGRMTVVLEPAAVVELLGWMEWSLDTRAADEGRSFFSRKGGGTRLGEKLFADGVTLTSDPADPLAPNPSSDGQGLPRQRQTWIERGVLKKLQVSRFWAQKTGVAPTASPGLFHLHGGTAASVEELVRGTKRGVLITRFHYLRPLDPQQILVTGLTRDGVFLIENGEIAYPVNNFRFNDSPANMLANVEAMTRDTVWTGWEGEARTPAMRVTGFNLASVSEAV